METDPCQEELYRAISRMGYLVETAERDYVALVKAGRDAGLTAERLCEVTGWSRATLYRRIGK